MRVRGSGKRNILVHCEHNDRVAGVKFIHRLAPPSCGKLNRQVPRTNQIERFIDQTADLSTQPMTMDFNEIEMGEAINQPGRCDFADTSKIICIYSVDITALELRGAIRHAVEHLIGAVEEMNLA